MIDDLGEIKGVALWLIGSTPVLDEEDGTTCNQHDQSDQSNREIKKYVLRLHDAIGPRMEGKYIQTCFLILDGGYN